MLSINTDFCSLTSRKETIPQNADFFKSGFLLRIVSFFLYFLKQESTYYNRFTFTPVLKLTELSTAAFPF